MLFADSVGCRHFRKEVVEVLHSFADSPDLFSSEENFVSLDGLANLCTGHSM